MKPWYFLVIIVLIFTSCKENNDNSIKNKTQEEAVFVPKYGDKFFNYDEIDFYHSDYNENDIIKLDDVENQSKLDQLKRDVVIGKDFPKNINQTNFLKSMDKIGYVKKIISKNKFKEIDKIFIEKTISEGFDYACVAIYRDVLVFKNLGKIVGIAKICFNCRQHLIIGTNADTDNFGQNGDYEKLKILLNQ